MNVLRRIGLGFAVFLFSSGLSLFAVFAGIAMVFGTPDTLKGALRGSGLYTVLVQSMTASSTSTASASDLTLTGIITPTFMQRTVEDFIDSTYGWARDGTKPPSLYDIQTSFTDTIITGVQQKVGALPPCTNATMAQPTSPDDVSALTCLPPGVSPQILVDNIRSQLSAGGGQTLGTAESNNPLAEQLAFIPILYRLTQVALVALPIVSVLSALGVVFWSVTKRSGVRRTAWVLVTIGLLQVAASWLGMWLLHLAASQPITGPVTLQNGLLTFFDTITSQLNVWWIGIGVVYVDLGAVVLLILYVNRPHVQTKDRNAGKDKHIDPTALK